MATITSIIIAVLSSSVLTGLIMGLFAMRKNRADTEGVNIANAMKIEELAVTRYASLESKLKGTETELSEIRRILLDIQLHVGYLYRLLDDSGIPYEKLKG